MSRILVDSSIWVEFFRRPTVPVSLELDRLLAHRLVCTTGVVKAEVIPGARTPRDFRRLRRLFEALPLAPEREGFWTHLIRFQWCLRKHGVLQKADIAASPCRPVAASGSIGSPGPPGRELIAGS